MPKFDATYPLIPANPDVPVDCLALPYILQAQDAMQTEPEQILEQAETHDIIYRYLMPKDGDCGFHCLGIPRKKVAEQLLAQLPEIQPGNFNSILNYRVDASKKWFFEIAL